MAVVAYVRVSTDDQTTENQKRTISERYGEVKFYEDAAVSGTVPMLERPEFKKCYEYVRAGDTLVVAAVDRLGRNTVDVLTTVEAIKAKGVSIVSMREGFDLSTPIGQAMLTMLSAVAQLERENIKARQMAGIERAKAEGKALGRKKQIDDAEVQAWRLANDATIAQTAAHFDISPASVKRAMAKASV